MVSAGIDVELADHLLAQAVLRKHPANGPSDDLLGTPREKALEALRAQPARIAGVPDVLLRLELASGDLDLGGVQHDHWIAGVDVRRERGAVLSAEQRRDARRETTEGRAIGIHDSPLALYLCALDRVCLRHHPQFSLPYCRLRSPPYRTATRQRPFAGALGPASERSLVWTTSAKRSTVSFPRPTQSSVPTMPRTIPRRKASDSISKRNTLPSEIHSARFTVRSPDSPAANAAKSWRPRRWTAGARIAAMASSPGCQCSRRVQSGSRTGALRIRYSYVRPAAENRAWNESSAGSRSEIAMSSGRRALTPLSSSSAPRPLVVRRSMPCPLACPPASVRPAPVIRTGSPQITARTRSSSPCTVGALGWIWNPAYAVPSYATRAFQCFVSVARYASFAPAVVFFRAGARFFAGAVSAFSVFAASAAGFARRRGSASRRRFGAASVSASAFFSSVAGMSSSSISGAESPTRRGRCVLRRDPEVRSGERFARA